jgi:hypothetical protein
MRAASAIRQDAAGPYDMAGLLKIKARKRADLGRIQMIATRTLPSLKAALILGFAAQAFAQGESVATTKQP